MKKLFWIFGIALFAASCGKSYPESIEIESAGAKDTHIISVVEGKYTLAEKDGQLTIKVPLKVKKYKGSVIKSYPTVVLRNAEENPIEGCLGNIELTLDFSETSNFANFLEEPKGTVQEFTFINICSSDFEPAMNNAVSFTVENFDIKTDKEIRKEAREQMKAERRKAKEEYERQKKAAKEMIDEYGDAYEEAFDMAGKAIELSQEALKMADEW